jgi:hypothetical protein
MGHDEVEVPVLAIRERDFVPASAEVGSDLQLGQVSLRLAV